MHWLWGILLGLALTALIPALQALLEWVGFSRRDDSFMHAFGMLTLILLCVLILRRTREVARPEVRVIRPDPSERERP